MAYSGKILSQLANPTGLLGRLILNRLNAENRGMNALTLEALLEEQGGAFLEIGFGGGALLHSVIASANFSTHTGIEISELAVSRARKIFKREIARDSVSLQVYNGKKLPFKKSMFTAVCAVNVIYFVADVPSTLKEMHRVLKPGGRVILTYATDAPGGVNKFIPEDIETTVAQCSFRDIKTVHTSDSENSDYHCTVASK